MPKTEKTMLEILFPQVRAELLRVLFGDSRKQRYVREMMAITGLAMHTIQDELRKLNAIGLIVSWSNGYHRFYRANRDHAMFDHLQGIVQLSERLPKAKHSVLNRKPRLIPRKKRTKAGAARVGPSGPPSWGIFKNRQMASQPRRL